MNNNFKKNTKITKTKNKNKKQKQQLDKEKKIIERIKR